MLAVGAAGLALSFGIIAYGEWAYPAPAGAIIPPSLLFFLVSAGGGIVSLVVLVIGLLRFVRR